MEIHFRARTRFSTLTLALATRGYFFRIDLLFFISFCRAIILLKVVLVNLDAARVVETANDVKFPILIVRILEDFLDCVYVSISTVLNFVDYTKSARTDIFDLDQVLWVVGCLPGGLSMLERA